MARLIDDLRKPGARLSMPHFVSPSKERAWKELALNVHRALANPDLPVIVADNVAEYYYSASDQEYWSLDEHFPNLAPPFPAMWFEHKLPRVIHSKQCGDTDVTHMAPNGRVGILMHGLDPAQCGATDVPPNAKWVIWSELFIDFDRRDVACDGPHGSMFLCVDAEGVIIDRPWMQSFIAQEDRSPMTDELMRSHITWLHPAFLAISFLHCKNVSLAENVIDAKLAKRYRERHGVTPTNYKTLMIEPLKAILKREGRSHEVGIAKAMHICRGHFRDYREGRGLFGKYKVQVWMPSRVRGTKGEKAPPREIEVKV